MPKSPPTKAHIIGPAIIVLLSLTAYPFNTWLTPHIAYIKLNITDGELWRLLTAQLLHTNFAHLAMNILALSSLFFAYGYHYTVSRYLSVFIGCSLFCTLCLYFFTPNLQHYVGLSGALHGIAIYSALYEIKMREFFGWWLLICLSIKIGHEQFYGASDDMAKLIQANVIVDAHLYGALGGAACFFIGFILVPKLKR